MDAFFAAVEEIRRPELKGRPVVIGGSGDPTKRGVVSTASYEARKYGVHSAMPLRTAHKLCPSCVFLPVDYEEYSRVSRRIKKILTGYSPVMEDVGIDEAFLDISRIESTAGDLSAKIKDEIRRETGLTCSIGIGPNKLLAKIASDMEKPDGLTIITEFDVEPRIWPLPIRKLWGVGPKTEAALKAESVTTIGGLAALPLDALMGRFGNSYGIYLYRASRGLDDSPLVTEWEPKSMSRETTYQEDTNDWQTIARTLSSVTKDVVEDLRKRSYAARTVTVKIRFSDFTTHTRAITSKEPLDTVEAVRTLAFGCLKKFDLRKKVRLIGVRLGGLDKKGQ